MAKPEQYQQLEMMKPEWQEFMLGLLHISHETAPARFKEKAFKLLQKLVPFDMALWVSGPASAEQVHDMYLFELPESLIQSWQNLKQQDRILPYIIANPGKTIDAMQLYSTGERHRQELYQQHSKPFGIEAVICTALPDPDLGLLEIMSLYRRKAEPGFSEAERMTKQALFPLMSRAWNHSQIRHLKNAVSGSREGAAAISDAQGWLRHGENWFVDLLRQEFPRWRPPELPRPLRKWLNESDEPRFTGKKVNFFRTIQNDMTLLQAQPRGPLSRLTPREEQIAQSFAAGLTYKEIARELNLAAATVRSHLESIYRKLEISSKVELTRLVDGSQ